MLRRYSKIAPLLRNVRRPFSNGQWTSTGQRDKATLGVFTPTAAALFVGSGVGLFFYFRHEKEKILEAKRKEHESKKYGRASVGGPFSLVTHTGEPFTEENLLGKWSMVYFGFTNCPDICPEELDKMTEVVNHLDKKIGPIIQPVFVSVDPARDSSKKIAHYLEDFHPRIVGLNGTYDAIKAMCKTYRVYFSTPKDAQADGDYLVDHSIYFYLMDPNGQFAEAFGRSSTAEEVIQKAEEEMERWKEEHGKYV